MSDNPFHRTRMGAHFYEHTVPELVRQIALLNDNLERLIQRNIKEATNADDEEENAHGRGPLRT